MIYCFTVPCAQALDLLPTDYEAYRYLAAGGYTEAAQRGRDLGHRTKRAPVTDSVADDLVAPDPVAVAVARRAEDRARLWRGEKLGARRRSAKHFCACGVARSSR